MKQKQKSDKHHKLTTKDYCCTFLFFLEPEVKRSQWKTLKLEEEKNDWKIKQNGTNEQKTAIIKTENYRLLCPFFFQSWIDKFQTAKAALASASVAAAVAAQATLQEAYDKCARISMSFTLRVSHVVKCVVASVSSVCVLVLDPEVMRSNAINVTVQIL